VKRVLVVALLLTSCAATAVDEGMVMSAAERQFLFQKMLNMQQKIDELDKALRTEKVRTGCA
jgi:cytochrome c556